MEQAKDRNRITWRVSKRLSRSVSFFACVRQSNSDVCTFTLQFIAHLDELKNAILINYSNTAFYCQ